MSTARVVILTREVIEAGQTRRLLFMWCPGCEEVHRIDDRWEWDGDTEHPTINPSIMVRGTQWEEWHEFHKPRHDRRAGETICCHSFIRNGRWEFLTDCTHSLAGKIVPMEPIPLGAAGVLP